MSLNVAVTVVADPPTTALGTRPSESALAMRRVSVQFLESVPSVAVSVITVVESTPDVGTLNVVVVAPAGTVTDAGKVTNELFEERATTSPPVGAALVRVTVATGVFPPTNEVGTTDIEAKFTAVNVRVTDFVLDPTVAEMESVSSLFT